MKNSFSQTVSSGVAPVRRIVTEAFAPTARSIQFGWDGEARGQLLELSAQYLELGVTEQVIYLRGDHPEALAAKIAEALPELRKLERVGSRRE